MSCFVSARGSKMNIGHAHKSFTLAEVLITLGIIGIVAAMTIPNLIVKVNSMKFSTMFKKSLSTLAQVSRAANANFDMDYGVTVEKCSETNGGSETPDTKLSFCSLFNGTLKGASYLGKLSNIPGYDIKTNPVTSFILDMPAYADGTGPKISTNISDYLGYSMADGAIVGFHKDAMECSLNPGTPLDLTWINNHMQCVGFIDVNGVTSPNMIVNCHGVDSTELDISDTCVVAQDISHTTDIYPIIFYDGTVRPATPAARYVINSFRSTSNVDAVRHVKTDRD